MTEAQGESAFVELEGVRYQYIRYGEERGDGGAGWFDEACHACGAAPGAMHADRCGAAAGTVHAQPARCQDCGAETGSFHAGGCVVEQCPRCHGQFVSCECDETLDGVPREFPEEEVEEY